MRYDKLLEAFKRLVARTPNARLYLVGNGVLLDQTRETARSLGLSEHTSFLGCVQPPYTLLSHCDCLALASDQEGHPMVLLEAIVLGIPAVATDIVGSRSVLGEDYGLLVPNDVEGLAAGMLAVVEGKVAKPCLDAPTYTQTCMAQVHRVVCGNEAREQ